MAASRTLPLRLTGETIDRLDRIAARLGLTRSGVIKFCTQSFLDDFERHGTAILPLNWRDILHSYDGRVARHLPPAVAEDVNRAVIPQVRNFASAARPEIRYPRPKMLRKKK